MEHSDTWLVTVLSVRVLRDETRDGYLNWKTKQNCFFSNIRLQSNLFNGEIKGKVK